MGCLWCFVVDFQWFVVVGLRFLIFFFFVAPNTVKYFSDYFPKHACFSLSTQPLTPHPLPALSLSFLHSEAGDPSLHGAVSELVVEGGGGTRG